MNYDFMSDELKTKWRGEIKKDAKERKFNCRFRDDNRKKDNQLKLICKKRKFEKQDYPSFFLALLIIVISSRRCFFNMRS